MLDLVKDIDFIKLNVKFFGYELARTLAAGAASARNARRQSFISLGWKPTTQADLESDWAAYWLKELKIAFIYHRKAMGERVPASGAAQLWAASPRT